MFSRVLMSEPSDRSKPTPGTCLFDPPQNEETELSLRLKRSKSGLILQPQPSDSSRDPLNFTAMRKHLSFFTLLVGSVLCGSIGPILVPAFGVVSADLGRPLPQIAQLNGVLVLFEGVASMFVIVSTSYFGRRHAYLACAILSVIGCFVGATAQSYGALYGSRILTGAGMAAPAVTIGATITDMYFIDSHGIAIALWQVTYCAVVNLTPIISAPIATQFGWRTCFWVQGAFTVAYAVMVFFLCPETKYNRPTTVGSPASPPSEPDDKMEGSHSHVEVSKTVQDQLGNQLEMQSHHHDNTNTAPDERYIVQEGPSYLETLKPFSGRYPTEAAWIVFCRPFAVLLAPQIFYTTLAYTISFSWFVLTGATYAQMYGPGGMYYQLSINTVGYLSGVAPMIGTLVACALSGPIQDYSARWLSVRNHGVFEPEYRLAPLVPAFITTAIGGLGWAFTVGRGYDYLVSTSIAGFAFCGCTLGICAVVGYANACYAAGGDTFGIMMLCRSATIFGLTYIVNDWLALKGVENFLGWLTGATLILYALGLPVYVYGKHMRAFAASSSVIGWACQ